MAADPIRRHAPAHARKYPPPPDRFSNSPRYLVPSRAFFCDLRKIVNLGWARLSFLGQFSLESVDFRAEAFHCPVIWLVLAGSGVVAGAGIKKTKKADRVHGAEMVVENGNPLAIEVDGTGNFADGTQRISGGGKLDWIENGDGQARGMQGCATLEWVLGCEENLRFHSFCGARCRASRRLKPSSFSSIPRCSMADVRDWNDDE